MWLRFGVVVFCRFLVFSYRRIICFYIFIFLVIVLSVDSCCLVNCIRKGGGGRGEEEERWIDKEERNEEGYEGRNEG